MLDIMLMPMGPYMQNTRFLVHQDTKEAVVVDPADANLAQAIIEQENLKLTACLLTHGHLDHISGVAELMQQHPEAKIYGPHQADAYWISNIQMQSKMLGLPEVPSFNPEYVSDGQLLQLFSDTSFTVLHTPGHTKGGVCYYCKEENFVLVGDTLFQGSVGRTDFVDGNMGDLIDSIRNKLLVLPDETDVMSGHGEDTTIGFERTHNPYI